MRFREDHASSLDRFEILAFHDASVKTLAELDTKLASRSASEAWGERGLTLPTLIDSTGTTIRQFGVRAFPTMILINPAGVVVHVDADEHLLLEKLTGEKSTSPTTPER